MKRILKRISRITKRLDSRCLDIAKRSLAITRLKREIALTRKEADEYEKAGQIDLARKFRLHASSHENRMRITLLR